MLYACVHVVSFPNQRPRSLVVMGDTNRYDSEYFDAGIENIDTVPDVQIEEATPYNAHTDITLSCFCLEKGKCSHALV